jgi:hypothetical protein
MISNNIEVTYFDVCKKLRDLEQVQYTPVLILNRPETLISAPNTLLIVSNKQHHLYVALAWSCWLLRSDGTFNVTCERHSANMT